MIVKSEGRMYEKKQRNWPGTRGGGGGQSRTTGGAVARRWGRAP